MAAACEPGLTLTVVLTVDFFFRCKDIEVSADNGDMAFQAVRIQQSVVEFILNHTEQIFSSDSAPIKPKEGKKEKENRKNVMSHHLNGKHTISSSCRSDVCREVRHAPHKCSVWTDETDEPGGGPGPFPEPQPSRAQRASAGEQSAGHQRRHALPHGHRRRQQVGTRHTFTARAAAAQR